MVPWVSPPRVVRLPATELVRAIAPGGRQGEPQGRASLDDHMAGGLQAQQGQEQRVGGGPLAALGEPVLHLATPDAHVADIEQRQQHLGPQVRPHGTTITYYYVIG